MEKESGKKAKVFYLDDDDVNIVLLTAHFEEEFEVIGKSNPFEAIEYLQNNSVDVILTDQIMPEMDGIEFLSKIKDVQPEVARILLTGVVSKEVMLKAINTVNIYRFHEKSTNFDSLIFDVKSALKMAEAIRSKNRYEERMQESNEKYKLLAMNVPAQIIQLDLEHRIVDINKDFESIDTAAHGKSIYEFLPEEEAKNMNLAISKVAQDKKNHAFVSRGFNFYESYKWYSNVIGPLHSKRKLSGYLVVSQDITERVNAEEQIMSAVIEAEDRQKSTIARDIHDGLQQTLTIALMNFESVGNIYEKLPQDKADKYTRAFNHLEKALHETRNIAYSLIPKSVEDFGYIETVKSLFEELSSTFNLKINFYTNIKERIPNQSIEYNLFRITQESLNNIIKYAEAQNVHVQLIEDNKLYQLTIEDDGKGFEAAQKLADSPSSFGLYNMQKRAESLSGKMEIDSSPGRGTLIYIEIPIKTTE